MNEGINVNQAEVESASAQIKNTLRFSEALTSTDESSTVTANQKSKDAYADATLATETLERALGIEADRIQTLGTKFQDFDNLMKTLNTQI